MSEEQPLTMADYASVSYTTVAGSGPDQTNIVVQAHMPMTLKVGEMDNFLDKLAGRLERQRIIGEIPKLREDVAYCEKQAGKMLSDRDRLDKKAQEDYEKSGRSGTLKHSKAVSQQREEVSLHVKELKDRQAEAEAKLEKALGLLNEVEKTTKAVKTA